MMTEEEIIEGIDKILIKDKGVFQLDMMPLDTIKKILEKMGFEVYDYSSNGWQVDFWYYFKRENSKYVVSGSLFYGNFQFAKDIDDDQ